MKYYFPFNKGVSFFVVLILFAVNSFAQLNHSDLWTDINESSITINGSREIVPQNYRTLELDLIKMASVLNDAPKESSVKVKQSNYFISLPAPDGEFVTLRIVDSPVMEKDLAERYPEIKTYLGYGLDNKRINARLDATPLGFHAAV